MRTPHPRAAWPSNDDMTAFNLIVIAIGLGVGSYLLWTSYHAEISAAVIAFRHREIMLLRHFTDRFDQADAQMLQADPSGVTVWDLYAISQAIGRSWRIPGTAFIAVLAVVCLLRNAPSRFRRQFDLDGLVREQAAFFTTTAAFVKRHLPLVKPSEGAPRPADYALTPAEWIARFAQDKAGTFDDTAARRALLRQLGPPWQGVRNAAPTVRLLFAAFALHLAERRDDALRLLGAGSQALAEQGLESRDGPSAPLVLPDALLRTIDATLGDQQGFIGPAPAIADRHAWTNPALMSVLNSARRRSGVLAPAQFAWVKLLDRPLWYALHALGYETEGPGRYLHPNPRVEAIGARDHWALERTAGRPVEAAGFEQALQALRRAHGAAAASEG